MAKIKICGITNYEDAINAAKLGADFLGFNFYKKSIRYIEKAKANEIIKKLPKKTKSVAVFVNESIEKIKDTVKFCNIDLVQLSGDENMDFILSLKKDLSKKIIKCFKIKNKHSVKFIKNWNIERYNIDYIMLDSFKEGLYGGTGKRFDWKIAKNLDNKKLFLSGGLNPSNVKLAIKKVNPYAVDVCSGVETYPGKKDFGEMKKLISAVRL